MHSPFTFRSWAIAGLLAVAAFPLPALAAKSTRVRVDRKGAVRIPVATLKGLGVKPDRDGSVWFEFPAPPAPKPKVRIPRAPRLPQAQDPVRLLSAVDKGVATLERTRVKGWGYLPGAPGTVYLATGSGNSIILKKP